MSQMGNTKLGFMNVPNGDVIAFDMKESEINPSVVYLSHDIAEKLGISVNTVKTHKKRSFKQLRGKMRGDASVFWLAFFLS